MFRDFFLDVPLFTPPVLKYRMPCQYNAYPERPCTVGHGGDPYGMCKQKSRNHCVLRNASSRNERRQEIADFKDAVWYPFSRVRRWPFRVIYDHVRSGTAVHYCELDVGEWASWGSEVRVCTVTVKGMTYKAIIKVTRDPSVIARYKWETNVLNSIHKSIGHNTEYMHFLRYFFSSEVEGFDYTIAMQYVKRRSLYDEIVSAVDDSGTVTSKGLNLITQGLLCLAILHSKCKVVLGNADAKRMLVSDSGSQGATVYKISNGTKTLEMKLDTSLRVKLCYFDGAVHEDNIANDDASQECLTYNRCRDTWNPWLDIYTFMHSLSDIPHIKALVGDGYAKVMRGSDGSRCSYNAQIDILALIETRGQRFIINVPESADIAIDYSGVNTRQQPRLKGCFT